MPEDNVLAIASKLGPSSGSDDEEEGLNASQLMAAEQLIRGLNPPYDSGPARPSRVAHALEAAIRATMRKIEAEDD